MRRLYLDHNASSPLRAPAQRMLAGWGSTGGPGGNPSSAHLEGRLARRALEEARERLAQMVDCKPEELVFTSGGTESNAWALSGSDSVSLLPIEHPSVLAAAARCAKMQLLPLDSSGQLDLGAAAPAMERSKIVSVGLANHETGRLQPVRALALRHPDRSWLLHTDASQAFGRIPVSFRELGVDLMTLSAHKLGGPPGVGALVVREGVALPPLVLGGPQEAGRRAGTESVLLASLFRAAAEDAVACHDPELRTWDTFLGEVRRQIHAVDPTVIFISSDVDQLPNTLSLAFPGRSGPALVHRLDLEGISVSHGSACASGSLEPSPVLSALGWPEDVSRSSVRISLGHGHKEDDAGVFLERLEATLKAVQVRAPRQKKSTRREQ